MDDRNARSIALEASLREVLFQIIKFVNEKKDHVPPIPNLEGAVSFPCEITIPRWVFLSVTMHKQTMNLSSAILFLAFLTKNLMHFKFLLYLRWP